MVGGLLLATCFVLPAIRACNEPIVPAHELVTRSGVERPLDVLLLLAMFLSPYLFGALVALGAALEPHGRRFDVAIVALFGFQVGTFAFGVVDHALRATLTWVDGAGAVLAALGAALVARALRRPGGPVALRFVAALGGTAWFGGWSLAPNAMIGVYVSALGSAVIAVAAVLEARARTSSRGWRLGLKLFSGGID